MALLLKSPFTHLQAPSLFLLPQLSRSSCYVYSSWSCVTSLQPAPSLNPLTPSLSPGVDTRQRRSSDRLSPPSPDHKVQPYISPQKTRQKSSDNVTVFTTSTISEPQ
ncbi:hypothetical protein JB92DRAFT_2976233 [Gautieria morchelliformis]|nr:hypothetical protein JB92DRAFT_2976233 [Gautieria morchelliformis]